MSKSQLLQSKAADSITTGAVLASLLLFESITSRSVSAQLKASQPSPTMQRLEGLQKMEQDRRSAEDAKWRSFPNAVSNSAASNDKTRPVAMFSNWFHHAITGTGGPGPSKCEFYWPGWKMQQDGTRVTKVRNCLNDWVAVDCKSLKVSWSYSPYPHSWSRWAIPEPSDIATTQMVAALCDNVSTQYGKQGPSSVPMPGIPQGLPATSVSAVKPVLQASDSGQMSSINVGGEGKRILQLLGENGILVEIRDKCPEANAVGAYSRFDNLFLLCGAALRNPALATETIAHEAVHVLQDCLQPGGIDGSDSITLTRFFKSYDGGKHSADLKRLMNTSLANRPKTMAYLEGLKNSIPLNMYAMEIEAHALEAFPKTVRILLETFAPYCTSTG